MELDGILSAHAFLRVERPPALWPAAVEEVPFLRMLGEMIAAALARGTELSEVILNVSNVTVEEGEHPDRPPRPGDYVAVTILGRGHWGPEVSWSPDASARALFVSRDLDAAVRTAGARFGYTRALAADRGSVTIFLPRLRAT